MTTQAPPTHGTHLRVWDLPHATLLGVVTEFAALQASVERNQPGAFSLSLPVASPGASALLGAGSVLVEVWDQEQIGAGSAPLTYVFDEDSDSPADEAGYEARALSLSGPGALSMLDWARVYPQNGFDTALIQQYPSDTPGSIVVDLLAKAHARGTITSVTTDCTATVDSAGRAWPQTVNLQYAAGVGYFTGVLTDLVERGFVDVRMNGLVLQVFVQGGGVDRPTAWLQRAREITAGERRNARKDIVTALLVSGESNLSAEYHDPAAITAWGRREGYSQQGGVKNSTTLTQVGNYALSTVSHPTTGTTAEYSRDAGGPRPIIDYGLGDWIRCDWLRNPDGSPIPQQVKSIALDWDSEGIRKASIELGDVFVAWEVTAKRRIDALVKGATGYATPPATPADADTTAPRAPSSVLLTSSPGLISPPGQYPPVIVDVVSISWPQVTQNSDGSNYDDPGAYFVDWQVGGGGWHGEVRTADTVLNVPNVAPGAAFAARVRTEDASGNSSAFTYSPTPYSTATDNVGPNAPSAPTVVPALGGLRVTWDGLDSLGGAMPGDYDHVEVHASPVSGFTPSTSTYYDTVTGVSVGAVVTIFGLTYGVPYFVRLVAVDNSGNKSATPGVQSAPVAPGQVGAPDIVPAALTNTDHTALIFADDPSFTGGAVVPDAAAMDGNARSIPNGTAVTATYSGLKPGRYRATWLLSTTDTTAADVAATLTATGTGVAVDAARTVNVSDLSTRYRAVAVLFTVTSTGATVSLQATGGPGVPSLSAIYVQPVLGAAVAEFGDVNIVSLNVGKLVAGTLSADVVLAANIYTNPSLVGASPSGPGVLINSSGIYAYNQQHVPTVRIGVDGTLSVLGDIQAGSTLPQSAYNQNHIQNSGFEDVDAHGGIAGLSYHTTGAAVGAARYVSTTAYAANAYVLGNAWGAPVYASGTSYPVGAYAAFLGVVYLNVSSGALSGVQPGSSPSWQAVGPDAIYQNVSGGSLTGVAPGSTAQWQQVSYGIGSPLTVGTNWTVGTFGPVGGPLAGLKSLLITTNDNVSGGSAATNAMSVQPGETWQVRCDLQVRGVFRRLFVRCYFYDTTGTLLTSTPPAGTVSNAQMLTVGGAYIAASPTLTGVGTADILSGFTPTSSAAFRATGTITVPTGAALMRVAYANWTGPAAGQSLLVVDSTMAMRALDGHAMQSATITGSTIVGSVIETAVSGSRMVMAPGNPYQDPAPGGVLYWYGGATQATQPRVLGYEFPQAARGNATEDGLLLSGGVAYLPGGSMPYNEQQILLFPRDSTAERATQSGYMEHGIQFNVYAGVPGTDERGGGVQLRSTGVSDPVIEFSTLGLNSGIQFAQGEVRVSGYNGVYHSIAGSAFVVRTSSRATKKSIGPLPFDPVQAIRDAPVYRYEHRAGYAESRGKWRIGPMLEDLPSLLDDSADSDQHAGYDLAGANALVHAAVREVISQQDAIVKRLERLEARK